MPLTSARFLSFLIHSFIRSFIYSFDTWNVKNRTDERPVVLVREKQLGSFVSAEGGIVLRSVCR
jgi:hypothetical protein